MDLNNSRKQFGLITILLHWSIALLMIGLIGLGWYITTISYYHPYYHRLLALHKSLGLLTFFIAIINIIWFVLSNKPDYPTTVKKYEIILAHAVHGLLMLATLIIPLSGYFISTAAGEGVAFFNLWVVPPLSDAGHEHLTLAGQLHAWFAYSTIALIVIHALAALKHEVFQRDGILRRMLGMKINF